jgi:ABC-type Fe3+-hydroxamate transport system substrate-binding protein
VKHRQSEVMPSQETCPNAIAVLNARERCSGRQGISDLMKIPSLPVHFRVAGGDGILVFKEQVWSAPAERSGDGALDSISSSKWNNPKRRRTPFAAALQILIVAIAFGFALSCSSPQNSNRDQATREVTDEAGRRVLLPNKIDRIVSLAPNLTEIVYAIGAGDRLVGRTSYCDYPPQAKSVTEVGDTMHPSSERIITLKPQIVLVSTASQLESFTKQLDEQKIAVYVTNPTNLDEIFLSIERLGELFGTSETAKKLADELRRRTQKVEAAVASTKPVRVFYQVSGEPLYTIGRDAYLTDLIKRAGGVSVTGDVPGAFPRYSDEAALASKPDAIILPTGGSMGEANSTVISALKDSPAVLNGHVYKINGDLLSRPGPRLVDGLEAMARALHPDAFK